MKVLHVINSLHTGGAEKLVISSLPRLKSEGLDVELLLLNGEETPFLKELRLNSNIQIKILGSSFYNPLYIFKLISYLNKYDLIHVHLFPAMYFVALAKVISFSKTKIIFTEHSTSNRRLQNPIFNPLERLIYSIYTRVICITEEVKKTLEDKLHLKNDKFHVIENGIDINYINKSVAHNRSVYGYHESDKLVCMVAGFRREKDHDTVIRALELLPEKYKVIFIGDGYRMEDVKALVASLDICDRVNFLGIRNDVFSFIKMSDIAVLSSHWEGFGLAAAEAMACGVPTIASNVNGLSQVVSGGGLLFEKGDVVELTHLVSLLEEPLFYKEISDNGKKKAACYDISNMIRKLIVLYTKVTGEMSTSTLNHKKDER
ncbi:glycosyltransferase [Sphingobacterium faecium]|uniref:glycosyltransferase n=1 Tax=Sphingobacterium faecium TaxID=34087 RepID=UPI00320B8A97